MGKWLGSNGRERDNEFVVTASRVRPLDLDLLEPSASDNLSSGFASEFQTLKLNSELCCLPTLFTNYNSHATRRNHESTHTEFE